MTFRIDAVAWITTLIAAGIAFVIMAILPLGYFLISYQYMTGMMDSQAEVAARTTENLVMANPATWQFEEIRLQEFLERHREPKVSELRSVLDTSGKVIAQTLDIPPPPLVQRHADIYDAGTIVGHVELARSLRPLLLRTLLIFGGSSVLGGLLFLVLRIVPLRAIKAEQVKTQELMLQYRQLQKAESLGRMAGAVAHHFNNMLCAVNGSLELAIMHLPPGSVETANLNRALQASHRATEVSTLMLTYLGQAPGEHEPQDLSEACRQSLSLFQEILPGQVVLKAELPSPGPGVRANLPQLHQVLANLLANAVESIGDTMGTVRVQVRIEKPSDLPAANRFPIDWRPRRTAYACIAVTDTGCGIGEKDIEKIFDPFFTTKFTGRGMGLSVVLGIVRAHDGMVAVQTGDGRGSCFRIYLPMSEEEGPAR